MKIKNIIGITSLALFIAGLVFRSNYAGSILVIISIICFAYWIIKTIKNRVLALSIIVFTIIVLYSILPLLKKY